MKPRGGLDGRRKTLTWLCAALLFVPCACLPLHAEEAEETDGQSVAEAIRDQFRNLSETEEPVTHLLSWNFLMLLSSLRNLGIGLGVSYEQQILPHLAVKGEFGHSTFRSGYKDVYCTTVSFGLFPEYYPISRELRKLYVVLGSSFDYLAYLKSDVENSDGMDLSLIGRVGYKFSLPYNFLLDVFVGYKWTYQTNIERLGDGVEAYLRPGVQLGFSFHHLLKVRRD